MIDLRTRISRRLTPRAPAFQATVGRSQRAIGTALALFWLGVFLAVPVPLDQPPASTLQSRSPLFFFTHNIQALAFLWSGAGTFGLSAVGGSLVNGFAIGRVVFDGSIPVLRRLALLAPHGVVEVPALWIGGAAGFRVPLRLTSYLRGFQNTPVDIETFRDTIVLMVASGLLIAVAAVLEAYLTPRVIALV